MPINVSASSGSKSDPVPAGTHHAVCYGVVAVGTQPSQQYTPRPKVVVAFEIPSERIEIKGKDLPRGISKRYTLSLNEKASLRKDLQSWRGRPFTPAELAGFDVSKLIGANCLLSVLHQDRAGATYANISSISALPKSMKSLPPENPALYFNVIEAIANAKKMGHKDINWPEDLPPWIEKLCAESEEYKAFVMGSPNAEPPDGPAEEDLQPAEDDGSVPF
jgi:hypothetical protein